MLEKLFGVMPDWMKSKLFIRVIYTLASLGAAKSVAFLGQPEIQFVLKNVFVDPTLTSGAQDFLNFTIVGLLMAAGEWVIQRTHSKVVLPNIQKAQEGKNDQSQQTGS